jgi:protein-L-isoaspartate(D-aspartate) O-methyltransferase
MEDSVHHRQLRHDLVETVRRKGISDEKVLKALEEVPRHLFINDDIPLYEAYNDKPLDIACGQTISQPFTVAYQSHLLDVHPSDKILEVGTGSGYQAVILLLLGASVHTIERQEDLYHRTKQKLAELGYSQVHTYFGDGNKGLKEEAPFDKIIVTAASPGIPPKLIKQLKVGGYLVIPVNGNIQKMMRVTRISETETSTESFDAFQFVPLLKGINKAG